MDVLPLLPVAGVYFPRPVVLQESADVFHSASKRQSICGSRRGGAGPTRPDTHQDGTTTVNIDGGKR